MPRRPGPQLSSLLSPAIYLASPSCIFLRPGGTEGKPKRESRRRLRRRRPQIFTELPLRSRPARQRGGRNGQVSQQHPLCTLRDAPFALRGAVGTPNSSFNNMDALRHSSRIGQAKSYTSSLLGALRQKMPPSGNRSLHTSRPLSAPVANPLSPHLPLKKPQLSATFSISHRIFGVALGAAIISIPLATRFGVMFEV
ncbi:hypothetical protein ZWY2020_019768 [Hordeum vulgare]|nr:hypothetical protein ZWY2020_019768 [Hordeum vulgare]